MLNHVLDMVKIGVVVSGYQVYKPDDELRNLLSYYAGNCRKTVKVKEKSLGYKFLDETIFFANTLCRLFRYTSPIYCYNIYVEGFLGFIFSDILARSLNKTLGKPIIVFIDKNKPDSDTDARIIAKWIPRNVVLRKPVLLEDSELTSGKRRILEFRDVEEQARRFLKECIKAKPLEGSSSDIPLSPKAEKP
jgi:hypothetical protein